MWNDIAINYWELLVAAVTSMILGYLWYGKVLFGNLWMAAIGKTEQEIAAGYKPVTMLWTYLLAVLTAYVMAHFLFSTGAKNIMGGLQTAFWLWLGFVFTTLLMNSFYENKGMKLFWINSLYQLVNFAIMAIIIVSWK